MFKFTELFATRAAARRDPMPGRGRSRGPPVAAPADRRPGVPRSLPRSLVDEMPTTPY